ncbi:MAG: hypothetical protein HPY75_02085 [Actinobacteria bacterium]|nr:hypothetical protein [Actinomycetota bacterium]
MTMSQLTCKRQAMIIGVISLISLMICLAIIISAAFDYHISSEKETPKPMPGTKTMGQPLRQTHLVIATDKRPSPCVVYF